jgi:uncharacterized membrane protein YebE (DUF533 family)
MIANLLRGNDATVTSAAVGGAAAITTMAFRGMKSYIQKKIQERKKKKVIDRANVVLTEREQLISKMLNDKPQNNIELFQAEPEKKMQEEDDNKSFFGKLAAGIAVIVSVIKKMIGNVLEKIKFFVDAAYRLWKLMSKITTSCWKGSIKRMGSKSQKGLKGLKAAAKGGIIGLVVGVIAGTAYYLLTKEKMESGGKEEKKENEEPEKPSETVVAAAEEKKVEPANIPKQNIPKQESIPAQKAKPDTSKKIEEKPAGKEPAPTSEIAPIRDLSKAPATGAAPAPAPKPSAPSGGGSPVQNTPAPAPAPAPSGSPTTAKPSDESTAKNNNSLPTVDASKGSTDGLIDVSATFEQKYQNFVPKPIKSKAFIVHHTAGRGKMEQVVRVFKDRGFPTQYIIDRQASVFRVLPAGYGGQHILNGSAAGAGLNNSNTEGVEVIAMDNDDVTPEQVKAGKRLISGLGYSKSQVFGHGEVNPGHRQLTEGMDIAYLFRTGQEMHFSEKNKANHDQIALSRRSTTDEPKENTILVQSNKNSTTNVVQKKAA